MNLSHLPKETADIITGRLVIENGSASLQHDDRSLVPLDHHTIEVWDGVRYRHIPMHKIQAATTAEGWPLYAGLDAIAKRM